MSPAIGRLSPALFVAVWPRARPRQLAVLDSLRASDDNANDHDASLDMTDFLQRESDVLGEEFGTPTGGTYATAGGVLPLPSPRSR